VHEASLVESLLDRVSELTPPGARVLRVRLRVGDTSGANAESLRFCFDVMRGAQSQAELVIEEASGEALDLVEIEVETEDAANDSHSGKAAGQER
jgi:Zn finger protein HypA/HybF involved in hydrogenase expression